MQNADVVARDPASASAASVEACAAGPLLGRTATSSLFALSVSAVSADEIAAVIAGGVMYAGGARIVDTDASNACTTSSSAAAARASRWGRAAASGRSLSGRITSSTTFRRSRVSIARWTSPMPPRPMSASMA